MGPTRVGVPVKNAAVLGAAVPEDADAVMVELAGVEDEGEGGKSALTWPSQARVVPLVLSSKPQ